MNGFKLSNGDLVISNNEIEFVEGNELKAQTIQHVLSTNTGEWLFNESEGVNFDNILGKRKVKPKNTADSHLQTELVDLKNNEIELAEKLRRRLDGE